MTNKQLMELANAVRLLAWYIEQAQTNRDSRARLRSVRDSMDSLIEYAMKRENT